MHGNVARAVFFPGGWLRRLLVLFSWWILVAVAVGCMVFVIGVRETNKLTGGNKVKS
jgi:hypothetical protein